MKLNKVVILAGPSGVGKATIEHFLFKDKVLKLSFSVSATTRDKRENEIDGREYHFISKKEFDEKIKAEEFIEWNEHFSNKYGTLKSEIARIQELCHLPFIEVETFGAENILKTLGDDNVISIFVKPPSLEELRKRIANRKTETCEQIEERMIKVKEELSKVDLFDAVFINDDVKKTADNIIEFIKGRL